MTEEVPRSLLRRFARRQRAKAVQAEALIWRAVRNRRCNGAKFQRQVPLGNYIVDFVCFEHRLIVEIDGPSHDVPEQRLADEVRDVWLRDQGFRVLRLPNALVIASTELAVTRIGDAMRRPGEAVALRATPLHDRFVPNWLKPWDDRPGVATPGRSGGRDRAPLGLEPWMSLIRPPFAPVLNR